VALAGSADMLALYHVNDRRGSKVSTSLMGDWSMTNSCQIQLQCSAACSHPRRTRFTSLNPWSTVSDARRSAVHVLFLDTKYDWGRICRAIGY